MSGPWGRLEAELDAWQAAGKVARLWWRDDDLSQPGEALDTLLRIGGDHGVPLHVAVIPARMVADLGAALPGDGVAVFQHGYDHINRAPKGEGGWELGAHRPREVVFDDLARGKARLEMLLADLFVPVLVPPWCRLAPAFIPHLPELGYRGLSCDGRDMGADAAGLVRIDAELDPVDWKRGGGFKGTDRMVARMTDALKARRTGSTADEPLGLNTHHLAHDAETWRFLEEVAHIIRHHPAALWLDVAAQFRQQSAHDDQD